MAELPLVFVATVVAHAAASTTKIVPQNVRRYTFSEYLGCLLVETEMDASVYARIGEIVRNVSQVRVLKDHSLERRIGQRNGMPPATENTFEKRTACVA